MQAVLRAGGAVDAAVDIGLVDGPEGGFQVGPEESAGPVAPDFPEGHALVIVLGKGLFRIVVARNLGSVVAERDPDIVVERITAQLEAVPPSELQFITDGPQVGAGLGRRRTIGCGQRDAGRQHVLGVADITLRREGETIAEEGEIDTEVLVNGGLPGEIGVIGGRDGGGRRLGRTAEEVALVADGNHAHIIIVAHLLVAECTVGKTDLEVVPPAPDGLEEGFLGNTPADGRGREESPAVSLGEAGGSVVAAADLDQIAAFVVVVRTTEETQQDVLVLSAGEGQALFAVFTLTDEVEVGQIVGKQVVTDGIDALG